MENKNCSECGNGGDLRFGVCWKCATAQSILLDGTDMYEKGIADGDEPAKTAFEKITLMREKGLLSF